MLCSTNWKRGLEQVLDVPRVAGQEVVDADHLMAFSQEPLAEVGADKPRASGDDRPQRSDLPRGNRPARSGRPSRLKLRGKIFGNGGIPGRVIDFPEPPIARRNPICLLGDESRVQLVLRERALHGDSLEFGVVDELAQRRVAAQVTFGALMKGFGINLAEQVAEVKVAIGDIFHLETADLAQVTLLAMGHLDAYSR